MSDVAKRAIDVVIAAISLVILAPVLALTACALKLTLGSPVLFRHHRPGLHGRPFVLYKFRTMREAYDRDGLALPDEVRLTRFGAWLRRMSIDELPELWNVLRGDMSLVGPRPLLMEYLPLYTPEQARRHEVRPGITGWAQVNGRNAISWEEKFRLDIWYIDHRSLFLDFKIILLTLKKVLLREGVQQHGHVTAEKYRPAGALVLASLMRWIFMIAVVAASPATSLVMAQSSATEPVFQVGDAVRITVWQNPELSGQFDIREDGTVTHPLYRSIRLAGMSLKQSEAEFRQLLLRFETNPQFVVEPLFRITILGEVRNPNIYTLPAQTTIAQAVAIAGGPTTNARVDAIRLIRQGQTVLVDLTEPNSQAMQTRVSSGDQILLDRRRSLWNDTIAPVLTTLGSLASIAYLILSATGSL